MAARQWTTEQRKRQSLKIRRWKPWEQSTGARTMEGKVIASRNAFKGGMMQQLKVLRQLLREQKRAIEVV